MKYNSYIRCMNVYSQKYICPYEKTEEVFSQFANDIRSLGVKKRGNFFYSVYGLNDKQEMVMEIFQPMEKRSERPTLLNYQSYYVINDMLSIVVKGDVEANIEKAYWILMKIAEQDGKKIVSPFYNEVCNWGGEQFIRVKAVAQ